jgi:hypothetical protein
VCHVALLKQKSLSKAGFFVLTILFWIIMSIMQLPLRCMSCGDEKMVEIDSMPFRIVSDLVRAEGFYCHCGLWNDWFLTTRSLEEQMQKLKNISVTHRKFPFYFAKTLRKAAGVQKRTGGHG